MPHDDIDNLTPYEQALRIEAAYAINDDFLGMFEICKWTDELAALVGYRTCRTLRNLAWHQIRGTTL